MSNVFLDPFQRLPLIPKSQISGENLVAHRKETQGAQAIVDGDQNLLIAEKRLLLLLFRNRGRWETYHIFIKESLSSVKGNFIGALEEISPMDKDHNGAKSGRFLRGVLGWKHVQNEAVFSALNGASDGIDLWEFYHWRRVYVSREKLSEHTWGQETETLLAEKVPSQGSGCWGFLSLRSPIGGFA